MSIAAKVAAHHVKLSELIDIEPGIIRVIQLVLQLLIHRFILIRALQEAPIMSGQIRPVVMQGVIKIPARAEPLICIALRLVVAIFEAKAGAVKITNQPALQRADYRDIVVFEVDIDLGVKPGG